MFPLSSPTKTSVLFVSLEVNVATPQPSHELLQMTLLPNHPRKQVSIDFVKTDRQPSLLDSKPEEQRYVSNDLTVLQNPSREFRIATTSIKSLRAASDRHRIPWKCQCCVPSEVQNSGQRQLIVLTVEKVGHTMPKVGVLLSIESATPAKNVAIMCSIVEVIKRVNKESKPRSPPSSSDNEYTLMLTSPTKVSAPFVLLKVNIVICKLLVDSGARVNIVSYDVSKMFDCGLEPCDMLLTHLNPS
ncbi:hypothetical protein pdam_00007039 [Pocillopora damicornis]|uniref:Uncharacterized protein n=1 Tax=Pocillopora damicornis TaxID=46731 RepID=A0A3M6T905_POCDA|nr:hypothetical protein pdam_00007039 [Pocillopora damicornis]